MAALLVGLLVASGMAGPVVAATKPAPSHAERLPLILDLPKIGRVTPDLLKSAVTCRECLPERAAAKLGVAPEAIEDAYRLAARHGWRAGYDHLLGLMPAANASRQAYHRGYARRIVRAWQKAAVRLMRARGQLAFEDYSRLMALLNRQMPGPGGDEATGWIDADALDRMARPAAKRPRVAAKSAVAPQIAAVADSPVAVRPVPADPAPVPGSDLIPVATKAAALAQDALGRQIAQIGLGSSYALAIEIEGTWLASDAGQRRFSVTTDHAFPMTENFKTGLMLTYGQARHGESGESAQVSDRYEISPYVERTLAEGLAIRSFVGAAEQTDSKDAVRLSRADSWFGGASLTGDFTLFDWRSRPVTKFRFTQTDVAGRSGTGKQIQSFNAESGAMIERRLPPTEGWALIQPFVEAQAKWRFKETRDIDAESLDQINRLSGKLRSGVNLARRSLPLQMRLVAEHKNIGSGGTANLALAGEIKLVF